MFHPMILLPMTEWCRKTKILVTQIHFPINQNFVEETVTFIIHSTDLLRKTERGQNLVGKKFLSFVSMLVFHIPFLCSFQKTTVASDNPARCAIAVEANPCYKRNSSFSISPNHRKKSLNFARCHWTGCMGEPNSCFCFQPEQNTWQNTDTSYFT